VTVARKLYWGVGALSVLIFISSFFMPGQLAEKTDFPWHIEHLPADKIRIFGLILGQSTTHEAEQRFKENAKPSLFKSPDGQLVVEMFFEQVTLAGLKSKIVASIAVPDAELQGMYERGLRVSGTGNGKKITLMPDDVTRARMLPITGLTYLPTVRLDEKIIVMRFGQPAKYIRERKSGAVHWLYPQHGLDITLGDSEKPVLQYVSPKEFDRLLQPLLVNGEVMGQ
jgi:hypothetical protein